MYRCYKNLDNLSNFAITILVISDIEVNFKRPQYANFNNTIIEF